MCAHFTFSPELAADFSPTLFSDMSQFARSSGIHTVAPSSASEPRKDGSLACTCSRETFGCSLHPTGRDEWIASMQDALASLTPLLESARARLMTETSGRNVYESLGKFGPDGSFWKTCQELFQTGSSEPSSVTWPASGTMQDGRCWALTRLAPRTGVTGGFCWPTPDANMDRGTQKEWNPIRPSGIRASYYLNQAVRDMWPTPTAHDAKDTGKAPSEGERNTPNLSYRVGGKLNPRWVSWLMNFPLSWTETHDIMRFNSKGDKNENKKNANSKLSLLQRSDGKETIQREAGRYDVVSEKKILQSNLHGEGNDSRACDIGQPEEARGKIQGELLPDLQNENKPSCASHRQQSGEQHFGEFDDTLCVVSCEMALRTREIKSENTEKMCVLRQTFEEKRIVQYPCEQNVEARRSSDCSWYQVEPNVGRVTNGIKNRVDRLKSLGNGQVPLQAALAFQILMGGH